MILWINLQMAPLYNVAPITAAVQETAVSDIEHSRATSCLEMLRLLDTVLRALSVHNSTSDKTSVKFRPSALARWTCPLTSVGLGLASVVMRARELAVMSACRANSCSRLYSETLCASDIFGNREACLIHAQTHVAGLAVWRAFLFVSLWWPISILSKIIATATIAVVQLYVTGERVQFVAFGTRKQCVAFVRACLWFAIWFPLTAQARHWAENANTWNALQGSLSGERIVWDDGFATANFYIWRLLLVYVLFTLCAMLAAIAGRALSLTFHSDDHFDRMNTYLANENAIQKLTQPCQVPDTIDLTLRDANTLRISGFDCAHWSALVFVTRVLVERLDTREVDSGDRAVMDQSASVARDVQLKLAKFLARLHVENDRLDIWHASASPPSIRVDQQSTMSMMRARVGKEQIVQSIIECAENEVDRIDGFEEVDRSREASFSSSSEDGECEADVQDPQRDFDDDRPRSSIASSVRSAIVSIVSAFRAVLDMNFANLRGGIYDLRKQLQNSHEDAAVGDGSLGDSTAVRDKDGADGESLGEDVMLGPNVQMHAWKLGYYLFWNLRSPNCSFAGLPKTDVIAVARRFDMPLRRAWQLLDHNNDRRITMDEVVRSVEQAYNNRTLLAKSLAESQTVVGQVQRVIYTFLLIVLAFVAVAIIIPGSVSRVWTSMSAGLLSFSFVFGNSIKEVFENCIFLFFTHPFDLGDKIRWNGETYFVRGITLNYVNLLHASGSYVNVSTHVLKQDAITNVTRSQRVWESIHFAADINTTVQQCEIAADKVVEAISTHPRLFGGMYRVWLSDTESANKIKISAHFDLKTNGMDSSMMGEAMTVMTAAFAEGLCVAGVSYTDLALACQKCWSDRAGAGALGAETA